jgi:hypothetical protein
MHYLLFADDFGCSARCSRSVGGRRIGNYPDQS